MSSVIDIRTGQAAHIRPLFDRLAAKAPDYNLTTAEQRIEKIRRLMATVLKYRKEIYETGRLERGL
ncbi:MAG: aldehyde dehydrogenase family protein, partial [Solimonas sp.]